jgi:uncharacterized membrane protein YdbT with pleckstrin-like domain
VLGVWLLGSLAGAPGRAVALVVAAPIVLSGVFYGTKLLLRIAGRRYWLTTDRLFIERGILSRTTDQTELIRVDDVRVHKTLADRIFGLGTVQVLSTDITDRAAALEGVLGVDELAEQVRSRMRALRSKSSLFIESL